MVLEVLLDEELELDDYGCLAIRGWTRCWGRWTDSVRFFGLTPTSMKLEGVDRHGRLIDSYRKLHVAWANATAAS